MIDDCAGNDGKPNLCEQAAFAWRMIRAVHRLMPGFRPKSFRLLCVAQGDLKAPNLVATDPMLAELAAGERAAWWNRFVAVSLWRAPAQAIADQLLPAVRN